MNQITRGGYSPTPPEEEGGPLSKHRSQAVADLHERLNTVELNALLARDPDLLSSLPAPDMYVSK
jgi:hypothetical protein